MKAFGFEQHGDISQMKLLEMPEPTPKENEVLIQTKASAFNHLDIWVRYGWPGLQLELPHISGSDAAGVIKALGGNVKKFHINDRVCINPGVNLIQDEYSYRGQHSESPHFKIIGEQLPGTFAEYIVVPAQNCLRMPENFSFATAAAAGLVSLTAWRMLIYRAKLQVGESVLIIGAGGGVNHIAIQIAKLVGAKVYALTSGANKIKLAEELGADVVLDYLKNPNWHKEILKLTHSHGVDVVVDNVGQATLQKSIAAVKRGGRIVIVGNTSGPEFQLDIRHLFAKQISLIGSTMGSPQDYADVMQHIFSERIKPLIHASFSIEKALDGLKMIEEGKQFGKVVVEF